ncbi:EmrB/QacA subfamily drug resistance transporter [Kitasatospora sp. MAP12-15]|uniref:MFS transporter n=1 Tax=unclassified Kitasatospora TaxID=2633591 RepID=UPI0024770CF0|nr:MFS transporter [Kitasatospora sp. MAP12-44]MDH6113972.1 EmrB/QacA subfamily drug resistance transporter [Kitasatospora sp. MAP12-44]
MSETVPQADPRRWKALAFIGLAQLMVVLDATIVNIALPSAQRSLGFSDTGRQWVITAYALAFGGLLLFGGRLSDLLGRRRMFIIGLTGFAAASALGGASANISMLIGSRALQGVFGAMLAPAALSLLSVMFTEANERAKAFGIYGAIAGGGGAIGLILGGLLTEYLNWRWTLFVNVPFAVLAAAGAVLVIREPAVGRNKNPLDIPGVLLVSSGLVSLVYGFTKAQEDSWTSGVTIGLFVASAVLLAAFVFVEGKVKSPLLPLRVVLNRNRGGVYLSLGLAVIGMFGLFLFLTYYLQNVLGYSPVKTGVAFLPMVAGMITGSTQIGARLMNRVPARWLMGPGFLVAAGGLTILTQIKVDSSYWLILPGLVLMGLGMGTAFMPAMSLATFKVQPQDAGVASAMVNTSQQVGGAIGTALLSTVVASAAKSFHPTHFTSKTNAMLQIEVHSFATAIWWSAGILALASLIAFTFLNAGHMGHRPAAADGEKEDFVPVMAH